MLECRLYSYKARYGERIPGSLGIRRCSKMRVYPATDVQRNRFVAVEIGLPLPRCNLPGLSSDDVLCQCVHG
jgi:hypothetical protein